MSQQKTAILSLIASQPNIRQVEISDKLDIDPDKIQPEIQDEIDAGKIIVEPVIAPNGRPQPAYRFAAFVAGQKPVEEPLDIDVPVTRKAHVPLISLEVQPAKVRQKTKIDLAIEYLRENAPVPTTFLNRAIGLKDRDSPHPYIATAIRDKRIVQNADREWILGPAAGDPSNTVPPAVELPAPVVTPKVNVEATPLNQAYRDDGICSSIAGMVVIPAPIAARAEKTSIAPVLPAPRGKIIEVQPELFVAGLLSNGELNVMVGERGITLKAEHTRELYDYLRKVGPVLLA